MRPMVWSTRAPLADVDELAPALARIRPRCVVLHTSPDPSDGPAVAKLRATLPGVRVWFSAPSNQLARSSPGAAAAKARRWSQVATDLGAEHLMFNCERPDWHARGDDERDRALSLTAGMFLEAAAQASPALELGITSHDCPRWHLSRRVWRAFLGRSSPVRRHGPQHYLATKGTVATVRRAQMRLRLSAEQWLELADDGDVRPEFVPLTGSAWLPMVQLHGAAVSAVCWLADQGTDALGWAAPTRVDAAGYAAAEALQRVEERAGAGPGAIGRFQASEGITADGQVGPLTLARLGVTLA